MEYVKSIPDLIVGLNKLEHDAWVHTDMEIWLSNPQEADFYYLPWDYMQTLNDDEVFENDDGAELPLVLKDKNLKEWMLVNVLVYIANSINLEEGGLQEFIDQVNYYREFDTFKR